MGFTRMKRKDRVVKYKNLVRLAKIDGSERDELQILKEWIGVAKQELTKEQCAEVLAFIYKYLTEDEELLTWLITTYGKEVAVDLEESENG